MGYINKFKEDDMILFAMVLQNKMFVLFIIIY